jgi:hypothetical protein
MIRTLGLVLSVALLALTALRGRTKARREKEERHSPILVNKKMFLDFDQPECPSWCGGLSRLRPACPLALPVCARDAVGVLMTQK